jgi:hypothetical protein
LPRGSNTRYLEAVDLFRSLELNVKWRPDEVGAPSPAPELQRHPRCERCAGPLARIKGQHVCLRT